MQIFESAANWGLGIVLSIIIIIMFKKFLNKFMDSVTQERIIYKEFINKQGVTIDNHLDHLTDSVTVLSQKINDMNKTLGEQNMNTTIGFDRVVDAIVSQTELIKNLNKNDK